MTTSTTPSVKTSYYRFIIPVTTYLVGTLEAPSGLSEQDALNLVTWEKTRGFEADDCFKTIRSEALNVIETAPSKVDIQEEPND